MSNFVTLYRYEYKKLINRKIVWISFALCVVLLVISLCVPLLGNYYSNREFIDTNYNMYLIDKEYASALSGRKIDQALLDETISAYRKIPADTQLHYTLTEEYQQYARPYSSIFNFIHGTTAMQSEEVRLTWRPSENDLYSQRQVFLSTLMEDNALSDGEIQFWQNREAQISKPIVYEEHGGYETLLTTFQTVGLFVLMLISISLSGMFFDEHTRKTDQIILCCVLGKTRLYWAKITAGIGFSVISAITMSCVAFLTTFCLYGAEGFDAAFQLMYTRNSDPITCGQAILIAYGCMMFAAVAVSAFVMVMSELLHSNVATLAISAVLLIMPMIITIPQQYRVLAQIYDWLPWCFLAPWNVFNQYTLPVFGHYFTPWQVAPFIYLIASIAIVFLGKPLYKQYQINGR